MVNIVLLSVFSVIAFFVCAVIFDEDFLTLFALMTCIAGLVLENELVVYFGFCWFLLLLIFSFLKFFLDDKNAKK